MPFNNQVPTSLCTLRPPLGVQGFGESLSSRAQGAKARFHCLGGGDQLGLEGKAHPPSPAEHTHTHIHTYTYIPPPLAQALLLAVGMHGAAIATVHRVGLDPLECHANEPATLLSGPLVKVNNSKNYSTPIASTTATTALLLTSQGILAGLPSEPSPVVGFAAGLVSFTAFCEPDHVRLTNLRIDAASYAACRACPVSTRSLGGVAHECESCNETTCARADEIVFNTTFDASGTLP